jgi:uncharacterized protein (DUF302 family)
MAVAGCQPVWNSKIGTNPGGYMIDQLGFEVYLELPYDAAIEKVISGLKAEGFGVLARIDVQATMKEKLGENFRPYMILGACNPPLAHRALCADAATGLMLPCNVTVEAISDSISLARIANPETMILFGKLAENPELREVATQARTKLERVAASLKGN